MFRRARLNVRPNVRPAGRGGGAADPEAQGSTAAPAEAAADAAVEPPPAARPAESDDKPDKSSDAGEASKPAEMPTQRRKRISTMPNLAKPRAGPSSAQRSAPKQQKRVLQAPDGSALLQKDTSPPEKSNVESSLKSSMLPEKKTPVPQVPQFSPLKKSVNKEQTVGVAAQKNDDTLQKNVPSPLKERPTQERSGTQEEKLPVKLVPAKEKQMCSDRERILKARKLREMLKEELRKERMLKHRPPVIEGRSPPDRSKMTMRDLIYYLPENNPMKSSLAEEKRTEKNSALSQMKEPEEKSTPEHEEEDEEEEAENAEESQDGPLLVPRVKVAEDGSIILDEESLTVEVLRTKGPCVVEENDPIFERGSTTTYSSFRKSFYTKPWSNKETDMFFLAISMVGTDFSLIGRLFPHRARAEIKNKFKREEKANGWRIDKAFKEKRPFDFEFFAQLLEKVLADEEKRKQKTVKSQKSKEKKPSRPRKKPKAKAASTEAANDQDDIQEARISEAETEADAGTAEKENEESLNVSEQAEEQVALDPTLAKKKRKKKRKDDLEQEEENLPEEMATPSKIVEEGKSSQENKRMVCDANSDGHTTCREEPDSVTEGKQDDTAVTEEERSESCLSVDDITERESDVNLCSFETSNDVILEMESAKLRTLDIRDDISQESRISELTVSEMRSKESQSEETRETKNKDIYDLHGSGEKQSVSESGSHSEATKNEKPAGRGRFQRPKPNLVRSSRRSEAATQEKMEVETSSPNLVNTDEKCSGEDGRRNRNEATEVENVDSDAKSKAPEKISKAIGRGCRQRFKPNVTRASAMKEEPEKDARNDKMSHPQPKGETEQNIDQNNSSDTSEEAAGSGDQILGTVSQSSETAGLQGDSEQVVLKPAPVKRGRVQRPKPNLGRTVARQKDLMDEKDHEEKKTKGEEIEEGVIHHKDENNHPCLKNDVAVHEDAQPCNVMLEEDVSTDAEMKSIQRRQCSQEKSSDVESHKSEERFSDVLKQVSDFNTGECGPQKEEEKSVVSSARLLRSRFQKPKPNLRMTTGRKEVLDLNNKGVSQKDTSQEESLTQCDSECSIVPDTDKAGKHEVLQPLEPSGKDESCGTQVVSERSTCASPKISSRPEDAELQFRLPEINQDDTSTINTGIDSKTTTEEESEQTPLRPVQLARSRFQRYKPNLERAVGKKELKTSKNEKEKKPEAKQLVLQKDESVNTLMRENEAVLCQADVLSNEEQEQQEVLQIPCISENILCEQSSTEKSTSQEDNLSALKPGRFRNSSQRPGPNVEKAYIEKESPAEQKLVAPVEEEANKGENLPVVEEPEELLSPKDDTEVLLFVENLAKNDNLDINPKSTKSEPFCFSKNSPNCHSKGEREEHLSTDAIGSIKDTIKRSKDKASSGEETEQSYAQTLNQARDPPSNPRPNLMRVTRKRDYPGEGENREDNTENRNTEVCLVLEKTGLSMQNSSDVVEVAPFSKAASKHNSADSGGETFCKRIKHDSRLQSSEVPSQSGSQVDQEDDSQFSTSQGKKSDNLTRQSRRSSKCTVLPKHVSELKCETDTSEKGNQEVNLSVTRGKNLKTTHRKKSGKEHRSSKITLVTLRTSQEEEEEEADDDFEPDDEDEYFAPEEVNKAPVFVPIGLRSPKPVPVQIEETMEELEIPVNVPDVQLSTESLLRASVEPVVQKEEKETTVHENPEVDKGINDGSAEAAMTLLAMGDPTFQLKSSPEEWTQMLPTQDELDMANSLVTHAYSKQNRTPSQYLLPSDTSAKESVPSEDGSHVNVEDQSTGTRIGVQEYSEKNVTDISDGSFHMVDSMRLAEGRLLEPEPDFGVLKSNENIIQNSLNKDVLVEQLEQGQSESTVLRGTAEMQKVDLEQVRPAAGDSSGLHDFTSVKHTKEVDKTERNKMRDACGNSGELRPGTASPKPEKFHLGLEDCPNQSSVDELHEQNSCHPEHSVCMINFTQSEACDQDRQQQCVSSTEETSVVNNDHRCPEEEQTFILTLVEITADSKEFDASAVMEDTSEPLLPAPILISPINTSETSMIEEESIGSLTTTPDEFTAPVNSSMETQRLESASIEPLPNLQTTQKRSAAELEEDDFPPAKKALSAVVVEDNLETRSQGCSLKSANAPVIDSENPFQKTEASAKEEVLKSVSESVLPLAERSQLETLENLGKAPLENSASKQEEDMTSGLTSNRKAEIIEQGKQGDVHESGQLEHAGSLASSSKSPLLRGGRKPLGFLSLICKKSTSESAEDTKRNRGKILKPRIVTPKRGLKKPTPSSKDDRESCSLPSTSTSSSVEDKNVAADAAVMVPSNKPSEKPPLSAKDQEKEEEPTRISEYFFSDIFMEVDDSE